MVHPRLLLKLLIKRPLHHRHILQRLPRAHLLLLPVQLLAAFSVVLQQVGGLDVGLYQGQFMRTDLSHVAVFIALH